MREPSIWRAQLLAIPMGAVAAFTLALLWATRDVIWNFDLTLLSLIAWMMVIIVLHEMIHAVLHPGFGIASSTTLGFWPSKLLFYAHYDSVLSRGRFVVILLGPFVVLSLLPLAVEPFTGRAPSYIAFVSVFNSFVSCVDALGAVLVLTRIPVGARVRNKGWKTYYRTAAQSAGGGM